MMPYSFSSASTIRGRKLKEKHTRNPTSSESRSRLSKKISRSSDEGEQRPNPSAVSPFDYQLQNESFCHEPEQLPPLPDSVPSTPASSVVLPNRPKTPESSKKAPSDLQPTVEDDPESSTPKPVLPGPTREDRGEERISDTGVGKETFPIKAVSTTKTDGFNTNQPREILYSSPKTKRASITVNNRKQSIEYHQPRPLPPEPTVDKKAASPSISPIPQYHYPYMNFDPFYSPTQHPAIMPPPPPPASPGFSSSSLTLTSPPPPLPEGAPVADAQSRLSPYGYSTQVPYHPTPSIYGHSYYGLPYQPSTEQPIESNRSKDNRRAPSNPPEDESPKLLKKIASAMPELSQLLRDYQTAQEKISAREEQNQTIESDMVREIEALKRQLNAEKSEFNKVLNNTILERNAAKAKATTLHSEASQLYAERTEVTVEVGILQNKLEQLSGEYNRAKNECNSLKRETEGLQSFVHECKALKLENSDLRDRLKKDSGILADTKRERDELIAVRATLEQSVESIRKDMSLQKEAHDQLFKDEQERSQRQMLVQKESHNLAISEEQEKTRQQLTAQHDLHDRQLRDEKEKSRQMLKSKDEEVAAAAASHRIEVSRLAGEASDLRKKYNSMCRELDDSKLFQVELRRQLDSKRKEIRDEGEKHKQEITQLNHSFERERKQLEKKTGDEISQTHAQMASQEASWRSQLVALQTELETKDKSLQQAFEDQKSLHRSQQEERSRRLELADSFHHLQGLNERLGQEKAKLEKALQPSQYPTESKSKGDHFFIEAFGAVAQEIDTLSQLSFFQASSTLTNTGFLADLPTATPLRLPHYITHLVCSVLVTRLFTPLLLARSSSISRFLDNLYSTIPPHREAVWRQTTLKAAYTISNAKDETNTVAATIVDDIIYQLEPFVQSSRRQALLSPVQSIVKRAAEAWRYARIEPGRMSVVFPSDSNVTAARAATFFRDPTIPQGKEPKGRLLLPLLPHIVREAVNMDSLPGESASPGPCIYLQGTALFADSPPILGRPGELGSGSRQAAEERTQTAPTISTLPTPAPTPAPSSQHLQARPHSPPVTNQHTNPPLPHVSSSSNPTGPSSFPSASARTGGPFPLAAATAGSFSNSNSNSNPTKPIATTATGPVPQALVQGNNPWPSEAISRTSSQPQPPPPPTTEGPGPKDSSGPTPTPTLSRTSSRRSSTYRAEYANANASATRRPRLRSRSREREDHRSRGW